MAILEKKALGLDIGADVVRVVELASGRQGLRLVDFSCQEIKKKEGEDKKESLSRTLKELFKEKKIKEERIVSALPLASAVVRNITFPFREARKIEKTIKFEAEPYLPFPVEEAIIDFQIIGEAKGNGTEVLMIAVDKKRIREHLDILSEAGIEPAIISLDVSAIFNAYSLGKNGAEKTVALVDIGTDKTTVAVVSEGKLSFIRGIPQGSKNFISPLVKEQKVSGEETEEERGGSELTEDEKGAGDVLKRAFEHLLKEIERTLVSFQARSGKEVEKIILSGGGSRLPDLREHLSRELDMEVSIYHLAQGLEHGLNEALFPSLCGGMGLALEGLGRGKLHFNFRKEEFTRRLDRARMKKSLIPPAILVGGIAGLSLFGLFMNLHLREERYRALNQRIEGMFRDVFPEGRVIRGMELELMRRRVEESKGKGEALEKLAQPRLSSLEIMRELFLRIPEGEEVQLFSLRLRDDAVRIEGSVASFRAVDLLRRELEGSPHFQRVSLTRARASSDGEIVRFTLDIYPVR